MRCLDDKRIELTSIHMSDSIQVLLGLLAQITGGQGGIKFGIVQLVIAASLFGVFCRSKKKISAKLCCDVLVVGRFYHSQPCIQVWPNLV